MKDRYNPNGAKEVTATGVIGATLGTATGAALETVGAVQTGAAITAVSSKAIVATGAIPVVGTMVETGLSSVAAVATTVGTTASTAGTAAVGVAGAAATTAVSELVPFTTTALMVAVALAPIAVPAIAIFGIWKLLFDD